MFSGSFSSSDNFVSSYQSIRILCLVSSRGTVTSTRLLGAQSNSEEYVYPLYDEAEMPCRQLWLDGPVSIFAIQSVYVKCSPFFLS